MYRYIPRKVYGVTDKNHVLFGGKLDSSIDSFSVLRGVDGKYKLDLTPEEEKYLVEELRLSPGDLNLNDRNNEYLQSLKVEMPKTGLSLDTNEPWDLLRDKVISAYDNQVAPNSKSKTHKRSYRYVRLKEDEETTEYLEAVDVQKELYKKLGALETNRDRMIMVVLMDKMRISPSISTNELRRLVNEMAAEKPKSFIATLEDPLFTEKGLIYMGTSTKKIEVRSNLYFYQDEPLAFKGEPATLPNAAIYLADPTNGDIKLAISDAVKNEFDRT